MNSPEWLKPLQTRGLIQDISDPEKLAKLPAGARFYIGFDPTAPSLQLGNFAALMGAIHIAQAGFQPIFLFGGATGAIGDPTGKREDRQLLTKETIETNVKKQSEQVDAICRRLAINPQFVNNYDWISQLSALEFLRDVGKHFSVNVMLAKDSVRTRLDGNGISYTEFSYQLIQSYDFYHLAQHHQVRMQVGGSDQWGNMTAGLDYIRKKGVLAEDDDVVVLAFPLVTDQNGKKFGKTEDGALWLDREKTSPYKLHQFLLNASDQDALAWLKKLTLTPLNEIAELEQEQKTAPEKRSVQKRLADEICTLIHGEKAVEDAAQSAQILFSGDIRGLSADQLQDIFGDVPSSEHLVDDIIGQAVLDIFVLSGVSASRGEAKRLMSGGGAYLNGERIEAPQSLISEQNLIDGQLMLLRAGKKQYHLLRIRKG